MSLKLDFTVDRGSFILQAALELPARGVTALFGRSGSGKTTLLRCIAGLKRQRGGYLAFRGETWQQGKDFVPTWKRPLGYVFQEASLFPHLSVRGNLEYGYRRVAEEKRHFHCEEIVALLGLETLLGRCPDQLSGGQRQRVALGRALLTSPELLLMDEPLASLDAASKEEILPFLERLRDELQIPIIYVSHAIDEVIRLADHVVLIDNGKVIAQGGLQAMLTGRELPFVRTESASTALEARLRTADAGDELSELEVEGQPLLIARHPGNPGQAVRVRILARDVGLALQPPADTSILNCLAVTVLDTQPGLVPSQLLVRLALGGQVLLSRISCRSARLLGLHAGQNLYALVKTVALG
ncbi:molybdenum ABC transporter ATP-binding protein [Pseudothauera rhizosphaerae]|uniref:Molybdenum ABC transporter ATP-binding protein n=1 Tax=Pseudothauera rhizosphaerae TaxID=2565932 RepID=A0A4S4A8N3_9RHOO|nr:molybdenum ABC transporter ATP-binding protein [Pseudothauera rhizosphaerae]THF55138.1 molybdenum ABC transporter ATP-binding protein [Pseudothauera rhizosphaerae]